MACRLYMATSSKELPMNRLKTIANRQRKSRSRDFVFACFIAMVALFGATAVGATIHAAMTHVASR